MLYAKLRMVGRKCFEMSVLHHPTWTPKEATGCSDARHDGLSNDNVEELAKWRRLVGRQTLANGDWTDYAMNIWGHFGAIWTRVTINTIVVELISLWQDITWFKIATRHAMSWIIIVMEHYLVLNCKSGKSSNIIL